MNDEQLEVLFEIEKKCHQETLRQLDAAQARIRELEEAYRKINEVYENVNPHESDEAAAYGRGLQYALIEIDKALSTLPKEGKI